MDEAEPKKLLCEYCRKYLGEMNKGRVRKGTILLCEGCWTKAHAAIEVAESASRDMPDFLKDVFK